MKMAEKVKPKIEDIASEYLSGKKLKNMLDFVAWMRANKITPTFGSKSKVGISYTSRIGYIKLSHETWYFWPAGKRSKDRKYEYAEDFLVCEELKDEVIAGLPPCNVNCSHQCNPSLITVCGKPFEKICGCCPVRFCNPDAKTLVKIKAVIDKRNSASKTVKE